MAVFGSIKLPEKLLDPLLKHMRASHEAEKQFRSDAIVARRRDYILPGRSAQLIAFVFSNMRSEEKAGGSIAFAL